MISERPERFYKPEKSRGAKRICSLWEDLYFANEEMAFRCMQKKCPSCRKGKRKKDPLKGKEHFKELRKLRSEAF